MKTSSSRVKGGCTEDLSSTRKNVFVFLLILGISLVAISFASELHFHYIQGFQMPDCIPCGVCSGGCANQAEIDAFWRAEYAEVFNSMIFLVGGTVFIVAALIYKFKKR